MCNIHLHLKQKNDYIRLFTYMSVSKVFYRRDTNTQKHIHICKHAYARACIDACTHTSVQISKTAWFFITFSTGRLICISACLHTYIHTYIHTQIHTYTFVYIATQARKLNDSVSQLVNGKTHFKIFSYVCICVCVYIYTRLYTYMCSICVCVHTYTCTYIPMYAYMKYAYIYI